jgi:Ankyrin repeats (3 copies)
MLQAMSVRDILSFLRALPPTIKDSLMTTLSRSRKRGDMELYVELYKTHYNLKNNKEAIISSIRKGHRTVYEKIGELDKKSCGDAFLLTLSDPECVRILINICPEEHAKDPYPLIWSVRYGLTDTVRRLILAGADVRAKGDEAIRVASLRGSVDIVELLLMAGANPHTYNDHPLRMATKCGYTEVVRSLTNFSEAILCRELSA